VRLRTYLHLWPVAVLHLALPISPGQL